MTMCFMNTRVPWLYFGAVLFAVTLGALVPFTIAQAVACNNPPTGLSSGQCETSCGSNQISAMNYMAYEPAAVNTTCNTGLCCFPKGLDLCSRAVQIHDVALTPTCSNACPNNEKLRVLKGQPPSSELCSTGFCCTQTGAVSAVSCFSLQGVTATCKTDAGPGEVNTNAEGWADWRTNASCQGNCIVKQGSELCAAMAKSVNADLAEVYSCVPTKNDCDPNTELTVKTGRASKACPAGQVCCYPKDKTSAAGGTGTSQAAAAGAPKKLPDPLGGVNIPTLIGNIIRTFAGIAGSLALLMFVYGGIMYITSGGQEKKVAAATEILKNAAIGIVLIFGAYLFVSSIVDALLAE